MASKALSVRSLPVISPNPKLLRAIKRTMEAYDALISDTAKQWQHWRGYGYSTTCRLCAAVSADVLMPDCHKCPLRDEEDGGSDCTDSTFFSLLELIEDGLETGSVDVKRLKRAAQARRAWLRRRFDKWRKSYEKGNKKS